MIKLWLASASPRRRELLDQVGIAYEVVPSAYVEPNNVSLPPEELVSRQALGKARGAVLPKAYVTEWPTAILGADTVVVLHGQILGKPANAQEAEQLLTALSGQKHQVITGVALLIPASEGNAAGATAVREEVFTVTTEVLFDQLEPRMIRSYIATGEPLDKAGAYGIQGKGALFVKKINGSYTNVVGLPVETVYARLRHIFGSHIDR